MKTKEKYKKYSSTFLCVIPDADGRMCKKEQKRSRVQEQLQVKHWPR